MADVKSTIQSVLKGSDAQKMRSFVFNGKGFGPGALPILSNLMDLDVVKAEFDSSKSGMAEYDYGNNTLYLGFTEATSLTRKALIVHEATHACYDLLKTKMSVADSESIAYIVQCQYARANSSDPSQRLIGNTDAKDKVFELGWAIAGKILAGNSPTPSECNEMREAVSKHPYYMSKAAADAGFNG
ncbi:MAG: hypothetical protein ABI954_08805 [Pyrinomonadaceae bacterium]